jgi:uncharacterized protein (TIGR03437 family)
MDTGSCFSSDATCVYQVFDKRYALFSYSSGILAGSDFSTRDPYYTRWIGGGGMGSFGPATTAEEASTSAVSGFAATVQSFSRGAIYNITSGTLSGRIHAVREPVYSLYQQNGRHSGFLGYPTSEELLLAGTRMRQSFEGGTIEFDTATATAVLKPGVKAISIVPGGSQLRMSLGETITLQAQVYAASGELLTDRAIAWTTTNGRVVTVTGPGSSATVRAVGGGTANVTAVVEGRSSLPVAIVVTAPCCSIGEGSPTATIQRAFQDAVARSRLTVRLPASAPVRRLPGGYSQEFISTTEPPVRYLVALGDRSSSAYVVTGGLLARYEESGGPGSVLGYPVSDASSSGRQIFERGALAGVPVRMISGGVLAKWAALGYEAGVAGPPTAEVQTFDTFAGSSGFSQAFAGGVIYAATAGPQSGRAFLVSGLILAKHTPLFSTLGLPVTDEFGRDGRRRQEFEGGVIDYSPGDAEASASVKERRPAVSANPGTVLAGARVRVSVSGFPDRSRLSVSISGEPDFAVEAANGAYSWDSFVPVTANSGVVRVRATANTGEIVETSYQIRSIAEARPSFVKLEGDAQTGAPGAILPRPLRAALRDDSGNAVARIPVVFTPSPGTEIVSASSHTDENGEATAVVRVAIGETLTLVTISSARLQPETFSARVTEVDLAGLPRFTAGTAGSLIASAASMLYYYQARNELSIAPPDADAVARYLESFCATDRAGQETCDGYIETGNTRIANLWRLPAFVGNKLEVLPISAAERDVRDAVAQGAPVLLSLAPVNAGGYHFVVASGIRRDGAIRIIDPADPPRLTLSEYLSTHRLAGALMFVPRSASGGFVAISTAPLLSRSSAASCPAFTTPATFIYCDGAQNEYQLEQAVAGTGYSVSIAELSDGGVRTELTGQGQSAFRITRESGAWTASAMQPIFTSASVVNAATFTSGIAPGSLTAIFGSGLAGMTGSAAVEIGGQPATVLAATPFQVKVAVPLEVSAGVNTIVVNSPFGRTQQQITLVEHAPAVFLSADRRGSVVNPDGTLNSPANPLRRGQTMLVFATGLGAVSPRGPVQAAETPVSVYLRDFEIAPAFAGLAPGFLGLYQLNVPVPVGLAPGAAIPLRLEQGGATSNVVEVSIR